MAHCRHGSGIGSFFVIAFFAMLAIALFGLAAKVKAAEKKSENQPG